MNSPNFFEASGLPLELWVEIIIPMLDFNSLLRLSGLTKSTLRDRRNHEHWLYQRIWNYLDRTRLGFSTHGLFYRYDDSNPKYAGKKPKSFFYWLTPIENEQYRHMLESGTAKRNLPYAIINKEDEYWFNLKFYQNEPNSEIQYFDRRIATQSDELYSDANYFYRYKIPKRLIYGNRWAIIYKLASKITKYNQTIQHSCAREEVKSVVHKICLKSKHKVKIDDGCSIRALLRNSEWYDNNAGREWAEGGPLTKTEMGALSHLLRENLPEFRKYLADYALRERLDMDNEGLIAIPQTIKFDAHANHQVRDKDSCPECFEEKRLWSMGLAYPELGYKPRLPKISSPNRSAGFSKLLYRNGHFLIDPEECTTDEENDYYNNNDW